MGNINIPGLISLSPGVKVEKKLCGIVKLKEKGIVAIGVRHGHRKMLFLSENTFLLGWPAFGEVNLAVHNRPLQVVQYPADNLILLAIKSIGDPLISRKACAAKGQQDNNEETTPKNMLSVHNRT